MIDKLRNLDVNRLSLEDAVGLAAFGRIVEAEYAQLSHESPDWLTDNLKELRREIRNRLQDTLERQLVEATSKLEALATVDEKRDKLRASIEALRTKLGK